MAESRALRTLTRVLPLPVLTRVFKAYRAFSPPRERIRPGERNDYVEREHIARYRFAQRYCQNKTVADIACGTGYGTEILREVAARVDPYDRAPLCGNRIIDLEGESWEEHYDVIVSFETIEHLANPEFFLENCRRTCGLLLVSTPLNEFPGYNPHHKQVWTYPQFRGLVERYFACEYFFQDGETIQSDPDQSRMEFVIAVGRPRPEALQKKVI